MTSGPPDGVVVVDKPAGITSHDVVARVRRMAGTRKVGHAGTLDPMATGVLVLGIGRATRLLGHLTRSEKEYAATLRLGASTTTDDAEGEVLERTAVEGLEEGQVREGLDAFLGEIDQVPAAVSAVKVDGKRAHARVRAGESVELTPRRVRIEELEVTGYRQDHEFVEVDIRVRCSSGTYIRSIARDLGRALGVGGHLVALRRTAAGRFGLGEARTLEDLERRFDHLSLDDAARRCFSSVDLDEEHAAHVRHGRRLPVRFEESGPVAVFDPAGHFLALYEDTDDGARAVAVFVSCSDTR